MTNNQKVILSDALDTLKYIPDALKILDKKVRDEEVIDLCARIEDDIRTVLRLDKN